MSAYDVVLIWAIGATLACFWLVHDTAKHMGSCAESLKLANETLKNWRTMIENTVDGKGKFVRQINGKVKYMEIENEETK